MVRSVRHEYPANWVHRITRRPRDPPAGSAATGPIGRYLINCPHLGIVSAALDAATARSMTVGVAQHAVARCCKCGLLLSGGPKNVQANKAASLGAFTRPSALAC